MNIVGSNRRCVCNVLAFLLFLFWRYTGIAHAAIDVENFIVEARRAFNSIEIDGDLTEPEWQEATPICEFVQVEPTEGAKSSEPMEVRILYDNQNIYFGFICYDSQIDGLTANEMRRDARDLHENDNVYVVLDTYDDRRNGVFFRVNPLGAIQDSTISNGGDSLNRDWDIVWECRAKVNSNHWTAELGIPFSQLRFKQQEEMVWGVNLGREIPRRQETAIWVPVSKSYGGMAKYRTANLGRLVGLEGLERKPNLELLPYILPGVVRDGEKDETFGEFDIGLDAKYGITSNLTADMTFNTDFAQVEADEEQVNLTRFDLFFPEKRPFFLEGAGLFDFGVPRSSFRRPPPLLLFYSRNIGIAEGYAVPIIAGGKVTGKVGPYGVGLLNILTDDFHTDDSVTDPEEIVNEPTANYSVFRMTRDLLTNSRIGMIAVNKQSDDDYNRAGGVDFTYRPMENLGITGLWSRTFDTEETGSGNAWYLGGNWRNDLFRLESSYMDVDAGFNPGVGFIQRTGIRRITGEARYVPTLNRFGIREIWMGPEFDFVLSKDNELLTRELRAMGWFEFERGGWVAFQTERTFELLEEDFEIREGIIIPTGDYHFTSYSVMLETDESKAVSGGMRFSFGDFFDGSRRGVSVEMGFKPNAKLGIDAEYQFNRVELPAGDFNANVLSARINYSFSTTLFAKLFAQLNDDSDLVSMNFLLNYIYRPGSNFFLVFNQIYDTSGATTRLEDSTFAAKMTYWWNP